jgi:hypothetical protein
MREIIAPAQSPASAHPDTDTSGSLEPDVDPSFDSSLVTPETKDSRRFLDRVT